MTGIYLSGTGNTKHCIEKLLSLLDKNAEAVPIEDEKAVHALQSDDMIILAYPVQYSNIPYMVRDFIRKNGSLWKNKRVFCMATMGLFSGDGTGCAARELKKYGAEIVGGVHIIMPDCIGDCKLLKKTLEENKRIVAAADEKLERTAREIKSGNYPKEGLSFPSHLAGLFGQRLWFYNKTTGYTDKLKISDDCVGCGLCESSCPMKNIKIQNGKAAAGDKCTMCYRCISRCPKKAVTLIGDKVYEQCRFENYV